MNISLERTEDAVAGKLIVNIEKSDYQDRAASSLKKLKQRVQMPGFRKGMVPMNLVQKLYGNEVKAEEIERVVAESVHEYIAKEGLKIMGDPLIADDNEQMDIEMGENFTFKFDLAFRPTIDVKVDGLTLNYYNIDVDDETVDKQIDMMRRQHGKHIEAETYMDEDLLKGSLEENKEGEEGLKIESATLMPRFFKNDEQKALFATCKKGDKVTFNPSKAYEGREMELASLLQLSKEDAKTHDGEFTFTVNEISHFEPAAIDGDFLKKIYPDESVKTEEELRSRVKEEMKEQYVQSSDFKFLLDLKEAVMKEVGEVKLAEALLKKMALQNAKEEDKAKIEELFEDYLKDLRWGLVRKSMSEKLGVKVDEKGMIEASRRLIKIQMAQYGITNIPQQYVDQMAAERLKDEKNHEEIYYTALDAVLIDAVKKVVKLKESTKSIADFNKMFDEE